MGLWSVPGGSARNGAGAMSSCVVRSPRSRASIIARHQQRSRWSQWESRYDQVVMFSWSSLSKNACLFPHSASIAHQNEGSTFGYLFSSYPKQLLFNRELFDLHFGLTPIGVCTIYIFGPWNLKSHREVFCGLQPN